MRRKLIFVGSAVLALAVLIPTATFVYIHFIEGPAPAPLSLATSTPATTGSAPSSGTASGSGSATGTSADLTGSWKPVTGSQVGYRVNEVLFGQNNTAVGRTSAISGQLTITGTTISSVTLTVDMTSVKSDRSQRDHQFQGRIMDTSSYPTATFSVTQPIPLSTLPADQVKVQVTAAGDLTLHGTTRHVSVPLTAQRQGAQIAVNGSIPIVFSDYGISDPSFGPVTTENHGVIELLVMFARA